MHPITPDGRYFMVKGQLWRCTNPGLTEEVRQSLVSELMAARRAVKASKAEHDQDRLAAARSRVHATKVALGERGPVWWVDGQPDYNRQRVQNTPYVDWHRFLSTP